MMLIQINVLEGRQGSLGHSTREGLHPDVADLVCVQGELLEGGERPLPTPLVKWGNPSELV